MHTKELNVSVIFLFLCGMHNDILGKCAFVFHIVEQNKEKLIISEKLGMDNTE